MVNIFKGLFDTETTNIISIGDFLLCVGVSLVIGLIVTLTYMYRTRCTKSFVMTLAMLPAIVCIVIMMVNGNIGTGVAVAGAFSLVRFRSAQGTAREIGMLFLAMGAGLISGMGYLAYAVLFTVIMCGVCLIYSKLNFGETRNNLIYKTVRITIPEDLDYTEVFSEIFDEYAKEVELINVTTTNLGSLFRLTYNITLKDAGVEKLMIDKLRCRNGNLEITISRQENELIEL
ncbi:MAG: DUF4956 domain-containing protein [Lachnospiraceae bacterium]|nr:DUF4956 domain-containing protein [Lachnospiraceae bacterium]